MEQSEPGERLAAAQSLTTTVLIPAYNAETTLRRAVDSVLAQTLPATEILVVDDGSRDGTAALVNGAYAGRVRLLSKPNGGLSSARNFGLREATGELIAFLDADDWWAPEKLARQTRVFAEQPETQITYTGLWIVDELSGERRQQAPADSAHLWPQLRWTNPFIPPSSVMMRRSALEAVGCFNEAIRAAEDWELWVKSTRRQYRFVATPEPLTFYQESPNGLSGDADRMFGSCLQILDGTLLEGLEGLERAMWRRRILSFQAFKSCLTARGAGDRAKERAYMFLSLKAWPLPTWQPMRFKYFAVTLLRG